MIFTVTLLNQSLTWATWGYLDRYPNHGFEPKAITDVSIKANWTCCERTQLMYHSSEGNTSKVKELLETGADPNVQDDNGWTPLNYATYNGHIEIVKLLLDAEVDIRPQDIRLSREGGHEDIENLLLDAIDTE